MPNLGQAIDKLKANGYQMITSTEAAPDRKVNDDIAYAAASRRHVDRVRARTRTTEGRNSSKTPKQATPITLHHVHFSIRQTARCRRGTSRRSAPSPALAEHFLRRSARRRAGIFRPHRLLWSAPGRAVAIHHIGFEVKNLEEFARTLKADGVKLQLSVQERAGAGHRDRVFHRSVGDLY